MRFFQAFRNMLKLFNPERERISKSSKKIKQRKQRKALEFYTLESIQESFHYQNSELLWTCGITSRALEDGRRTYYAPDLQQVG
jgi:hypothetical protein